MMAEPTSTTAAAGWAVAAGALGAFFAAIGVTWDVVFWGVLGGIFGQPHGPAIGRYRAILMFPASTLLSAKAGMMASAMHFGGSEGWAQLLAAGFGIAFYPLVSALVSGVPAIIRSRIGGGSSATDSAP